MRWNIFFGGDSGQFRLLKEEKTDESATVFAALIV